MNILDELRREFPAWTFGPLAGGLTAKCWRGTVEPASDQTDYYATVSHAGRGRFLGAGVDGKGRTFPTVTEAAEYALGEKAESTKARENGRGTLDDIDEALAALRNAFPGCTWSAALGKDARGSCIHADEDTDSPVDVQFMAPGRWLTIRGNREWSGTTAIESFHRFDSGLPCDITTTGRVINAKVPPGPPSTQVRPAHCGGTSNPYECIKVIRAWGLNFELGNVAKYLSRAGKKPGVDAVDDLKKLITYAQMEIERLETKP